MGVFKRKTIFVAIQYTDEKSVLEIMKEFGSIGFNNSPEGLYHYSDNSLDFIAKRGDWIIKDIFIAEIAALTTEELNEHFEEVKI